MTDCKKWIIARKTFYWTIGHMTIVSICVDLTHHFDEIHPYLFIYLFINTSLAVPRALVYRLQHHTTFKIQIGC